MAFWTSIVSRIVNRVGFNTTRQHALPPFLQLPEELFAEILAYLEGSDLVCLSLCNLALGHKLAEARASPSISDRHGSEQRSSSSTRKGPPHSLLLPGLPVAASLRKGTATRKYWLEDLER